MSEGEEEYAFTFRVKRRSKPNPRYDGILRTHRFYIEYYGLLSGQDPLKVLADEAVEPKVAFPARFTEAILDFAKEVGGKVVEARRVKPPRVDAYYERPIVVLPNEVAFRRHLLFSLTASTYRKPERLNALRSLVLDMNANFLNILTAMALDRYSGLRGESSPAWPWYMMRVGRAVKVLYRLD